MIFGKLLAPTKYRREPVDVVKNKDIVISLYYFKKEHHRYTSRTERGKRSRIDFVEGFYIDDPDLRNLRRSSYLI